MLIEIKGYPILMSIGWLESERQSKQEVKFTLSIEFKSSSEGYNDELSNTIDYGNLLFELEQYFSGKECKLLETVLFETKDLLWRVYPQIESMKISVEKPLLEKVLTKGGKILVSDSFSKHKNENS